MLNSRAVDTCLGPRPLRHIARVLLAILEARDERGALRERRLPAERIVLVAGEPNVVVLDVQILRQVHGAHRVQRQRCVHGRCVELNDVAFKNNIIILFKSINSTKWQSYQWNSLHGVAHSAHHDPAAGSIRSEWQTYRRQSACPDFRIDSSQRRQSGFGRKRPTEVCRIFVREDI